MPRNGDFRKGVGDPLFLKGEEDWKLWDLDWRPEDSWIPDETRIRINGDGTIGGRLDLMAGVSPGVYMDRTSCVIGSSTVAGPCELHDGTQVSEQASMAAAGEGALILARKSRIMESASVTAAAGCRIEMQGVHLAVESGVSGCPDASLVLRNVSAGGHAVIQACRGSSLLLQDVQLRGAGPTILAARGLPTTVTDSTVRGWVQSSIVKHACIGPDVHVANAIFTGDSNHILNIDGVAVIQDADIATPQILKEYLQDTGHEVTSRQDGVLVCARATTSLPPPYLRNALTIMQQILDLSPKQQSRAGIVR